MRVEAIHTCAALCLSALFSTPTLAQQTFQSYVVAEAQADRRERGAQGGTSVNSSFNYSQPNFYSVSSQASARTGRGSIGVSASTVANADGSSIGGYAKASGSVEGNAIHFFSEHVDVTKEEVIVTTRIHVSGSVSASGSTGWYSSSSWGLRLTMGLADYEFGGGFNTTSGPVGDTATDIFVQYPVYNGLSTVKMLANVNVSTNSLGETQGSGNATASFGNTFTWGGIVEARDSSGNLIPDLIATDQDGKDWTNPLPSPSTAIIIAPLSLILGFRRRNS